MLPLRKDIWSSLISLDNILPEQINLQNGIDKINDYPRPKVER